MEKTKGKKILVRIAIAVAILLVLCTFLSNTIYSANLPQVTIQKVETNKEMEISSETVGTVVFDMDAAQYNYPLTIRKIHVSSGDRVAAGDLLIEVDTGVFEVEIMKRNSAIQTLQSQLASPDLDEATRAQLRTDLQIAQRELSEYKEAVPLSGQITAAHDSFVYQVFVDEGQTVLENTQLLTLRKVGSLPSIEFTLPNDFANTFKVGDDVQYVYVKPSESNRNTTDLVKGSAQISEKRFDEEECYFSVQTAQEDGKHLYPHQQVDVTLIVSLQKYSYVVPLSAVFRVDKDVYVNVIEKKPGLFGEETYVRQVKVEEVASNNVNMAIYGDGIYEMEVITASSAPLSNGEVVKLEQ